MKLHQVTVKFTSVVFAEDESKARDVAIDHLDDILWESDPSIIIEPFIDDEWHDEHVPHGGNGKTIKKLKSHGTNRR